MHLGRALEFNQLCKCIFGCICSNVAHPLRHPLVARNSQFIGCVLMHLYYSQWHRCLMKCCAYEFGIGARCAYNPLMHAYRHTQTHIYVLTHTSVSSAGNRIEHTSEHKFDICSLSRYVLDTHNRSGSLYRPLSHFCLRFLSRSSYIGIVFFVVASMEYTHVVDGAITLTHISTVCNG